MRATLIISALAGLLTLVGSSSVAYAQNSTTQDSYSQKQAEDLRRYTQQREQELSDYQQSRQEQFIEYQIFREKMQEEFLKQLREPWQEAEIQHSKSRYQSPKPKELDSLLTVETTPTQREVVESQKITSQQDDAPTTNHQLERIAFDFYGAQLQLSSTRNALSLSSTSNDAVADMWSALDDSHALSCSALLKDIVSYKSRLQLNDYSFFMLLDEISQQLFSDNNEQVVFQNYLLLKCGYDSLIAKKDDALVLLLSLKEEIWGRAYVISDKKCYYLYSKATLEGVENFSIVKQPLSFSALTPASTKIESEIKLPSNPKSFNIATDQIEVRGSVNLNLIDLYNNYPLCENRVYRDAPLSSSLHLSLIGSLKEDIEGKSVVEALGVVLGFVQGGFKYMRDADQFRREKPMFPEELLFYPASDCEDRAHLFAHLVTALLALDVVFVQYSDHLATAVGLPTEINSDYKQMKIGRQFFTICDPTSRQKVGVPMPNYRDREYKIVL